MISFKDLFFNMEYTELLEAKYTNQTPDEKEYSDWEDTMNKTFNPIGNIGNTKIVKSGHFDTPRYPDNMKGKMTFSIVKERGYALRGKGLSNKIILDIVEKAVSKEGLSPFKNNNKVLLVYKNNKGTYDAISIKYQSGALLVITSIQGKQEKPTYNSNKGQIKVILEKFLVIELD